MKGSGELGPRMNKFYVQMDSSLMHTMIFPKKFAKMFKGSKSKNVELKGPSGIAWHVKMIRFNDTYALRSGWKEFVRANRIDNNDLLVFTYKGNSCFKVIIFDRSGCQKAAPFFAKKTESEESNDSLIREVKKEIISLSSGSSNTDESSTEISARATRARTAGKRICGKRKQRVCAQESSESESETDKGEHETVKKRKTRENNRAKKDSCLYVVSRKTHITKAQEEIANRMTRKTQKGSYFFVKILTHTETSMHKYCRLNLPTGFACKSLQSEKKKITLLFADLDKRSDICTASYTKTKTTRFISQGWREFASKNRLKQGNLCLFELRKQDKRGSLTMVVHLIGEEQERERGIMKGSGKLGPRMNKFYVQMDSSLMHTMIFPKKFAKMFKGSKSKNVELKGPSGIAWHVKMIRFNDTYALRSGWKEFVRANRIDNNDLLVFTYKGNSSFKVIISDRSGCQKAAPLFAKKTESEESNDSLIPEVKKEIISLSSGSSNTDESSTEISTRATQARTAGKKICGKWKQRVFAQESSESESESDKGEHKTVEKRKTRENSRAKKDSCLYVVSRNTYLTKAQEEIANKMTRKTQKDSYLFVKILTHTETYIHSYCRLNLPSGFACEVLQSEKKKITLLFADLDKRSNICTARYSKTKTTRFISQGWCEFVSKNGLKQGNLCLFELRKQDKRGSLTMVVHLIG